MLLIVLLYLFTLMNLSLFMLLFGCGCYVYGSVWFVLCSFCRVGACAPMVGSASVLWLMLLVWLLRIECCLVIGLVYRLLGVIWWVLYVVNGVGHVRCVYYVCLCLLLCFVCGCCFDLRFVLLRM